MERSLKYSQMLFSTIFHCSEKNLWNTLKWIIHSLVLSEKDHRLDTTILDWMVQYLLTIQDKAHQFIKLHKYPNHHNNKLQFHHSSLRKMLWEMHENIEKKRYAFDSYSAIREEWKLQFFIWQSEQKNKEKDYWKGIILFEFLIEVNC